MESKDRKSEEKFQEFESQIPAEESRQLESIREELKSVWPKLLRDITEDEEHTGCGSAIAWLKRLLEKNVPFGKHNRAVAAILFYRALCPLRTQEEDYENCVLAWCLEILQTASLIADDIMDGSETRRGSPCWYRQEDVGMVAVNDCFLLENLVYEILHKYFRHKDSYHAIVRLLQKTAYRTILGQNLDTRVGILKDTAAYTEELYSTIVKYKTSYYTYCAPLQAAMLGAGMNDPELHKEIEELMIEFGEYFQIQDDYLDCYGDPKVTGKVGTDIEDGKCSWLFVQALKVGSPVQIQILEENYGSFEKEKERKVKEIYNAVGMKNIYEDYEEDIYAKLSEKIKSLPPAIPKKPLRQMLNSIYRRRK